MFARLNLFAIDEQLKRDIRQIFPVLCGCLIPVTFGMMLGWPSLAYPYLLQPDTSPIPITLDQTSLIAGFLMEGNSIGTLLSTSKILSSKTSVLFCCCLQFFGWCVMFGANDIFGLLVARASVGFGTGYGTGQLKRYVRETCDAPLANSIINLMPLGVNVGVVLIYFVGAFVPFRTMAALSAAIPMMAAVLFGVIPKRPTCLIQKKSQVIRNILGTRQGFPMGMDKIAHSLSANAGDEYRAKQVSPVECLRDRRNRNALALILLLVFVQQYTGGPANIVYSQIIFAAAGNPHPKICSIMYAVFFFFATLTSLTFARTVPRKINLLLSCGVCAVTTGVLSLYFYVKHELLQMNPYFAWAPLFILMLFNAFHTFGIATVPLLVADEKVPKRGRDVANKFWVVHFSMSAVISTKIFQVLFGACNMAVAYAFFVFVALAGFFAVLVFMDEYDPVDEKCKSEFAYEKIDVGIDHIQISKL